MGQTKNKRLGGLTPRTLRLAPRTENIVCDKLAECIGVIRAAAWMLQERGMIATAAKMRETADEAFIVPVQASSAPRS